MKRYLITGASRGIGRAIAEKLAGESVELLLHGRDAVALAQTRKTVQPKCARVTMLIHDLATARGVSDLIGEVGREPIDLLVNNAGIAIVKPFTEITSAEWEQIIGVNITAPFLLSQRFAPRMPLCISVRFQIVACELVICVSAVVAMAETISRTAVETISSMSENPDDDRSLVTPRLPRTATPSRRRPLISESAFFRPKSGR